MNPLLTLHHAANAETQAYDSIEIVSTFGHPQAEYSAIRKACGIMDLPQRGLVELTGKDRHAFLNNLISNQVFDKASKTGLSAGTCVYAFLLNLKGRVVLDMNVLELGDRTLLEIDVRFADMLAKLLDRYLFAESVRIAPRPDLHQIALHGRGAIDLLDAEGIGPGDARVRQARFLGVDLTIWRSDPCGVPGLHLVCPDTHAAAVWEHLLTRHGQEQERPETTPGKRRLRPVGWAAFNATRIEAGTPIFGIDFENAEPSMPGAKASPEGSDDAPRATGVLPAETGLLDQAVSFTKGCYLGQEVVARMHARGQVARKLVGLKVSDDALPIAGQHVFDADQNQIGVITSSTMSPVLSDAAIALALVRKPHFAPGTEVRVPAEGAVRPARVMSLPFV